MGRRGTRGTEVPPGTGEPPPSSDLTPPFPQPGSRAELEEGAVLSPRFWPDGLITCVAADAHSGQVLMVAHMNAEALRRTIETGQAWYFSRSRGALWRKGATSGQIQTVVEMRVDCDQDAILLRVRVGGDGGGCHTGRRSCFYRVVEVGEGALGRPLLVDQPP